jgi:multiple sugar transport system permease protein
MPQVYVIPRFLQYYAFDFFGIGQIFRLFTGKPFTVNLIGSYWTMLLPALFGSGIRNGLFIYIFRQHFKNMPKELEDAAYIDGCGPLRAFFRVMVPSATVTFVMVLIFAVVWNWNDYLNSSMYLAAKTTLSTKLLSLQSSLAQMMFTMKNQDTTAKTESNPYVLNASIQAGCFLVIVPLITMYMFLQKRFVESVERTGIVS